MGIPGIYAGLFTDEWAMILITGLEAKTYPSL
jgi:hypothetical protein